MRVDWYDAELEALQIDLTGAPRRVQFKAKRTLREKVGPALHREMKRDARGHRFLGHLPKSVTWEMLDDWGIEAGLEPKSRTQGRLAHIIVYGSVNNAPVYDHTAALRRVQSRAVAWLADDAEDSVLGDS